MRDGDLTPIPAIQGRGPASPLVGRTVQVTGRVTGVTAAGFFLQDALGDGDPATSDAVYVYTHSRPSVVPGSCVRVEGAQVAEYYARTELNWVDQIVAGDFCPPQAVTPVSVEWLPPGHAAGDQWEALEGMLVRLLPPAAVVHGPTRRYAGGEMEIALQDARQLVQAAPGHLFQHASIDGHPATDTLIYLSNRLGADLPAVDWGDRLEGEATGLVGVIDYHFGKFQLLLLPDQPLRVTRMPRPVTLPDPARDDEYTVCTVNLYGLGRGAQQFADADRYVSALSQRAAAIAEPLQGCTIVALQETGTPADADALAATLTQEFGLDYIAAALPGPAGDHPDFPLTLSLLVRSDRVAILALEQVQGCTAQDHGIVAPGVCAPGSYPLFDRPPLVAQLAVTGPWPTPQRLWLINNHWKSKAGDERANAKLRAGQADAVAQRVAALVAQDPSLPVMVIGDLNDFFDGPALAMVEEAVTPPLLSLLRLVAPGDRYTYLFNGAAQALDHALVTADLAAQIAAVHLLHINADYADLDATSDAVRDPAWLRSSDHDPILIRLRPAGAAILGGNLKAGAIGIRATDAQGNLLATAVSDPAGDFRLWGLSPGQVVELHLDLPPGAVATQTTLRILTAPGYQTPALPVVTMTAPPTALWLALFTSHLAAQLVTVSPAP